MFQLNTINSIAKSVIPPTRSALTAWQKLRFHQMSCEEALWLVVDEDGQVVFEQLDPKLTQRFYHDCGDLMHEAQVIPLLLWQGCYYIGCHQRPPGLEQALMDQLGTQVELISITPASYHHWLAVFEHHLHGQPECSEPTFPADEMLSHQNWPTQAYPTRSRLQFKQAVVNTSIINANYQSSARALTLEATVEELILYDERLACHLPGSELFRLFKENPLLPGVILVDAGRFQGMVARQRFYEHITSMPYSIDVFWNRPIRILHQFFLADLLVIPGHTPIFAAARQSLQRPSTRIHEPIVVEIASDQHQLLDVHQLLLAQAHVHELTVEALREAKTTVDQANQDLELRVSQRTLELKQANQALRSEISQRERTQEQLIYQTLHDSLTGLPNRDMFIQRVSTCLDQIKRDPTYNIAILFIDCDRFKMINDSLGHSVGDQVLIAVARRLETCLGPLDLLARLGGDEFVILLDPISQAQQATVSASHIQAKLQSPLQVDPYEVFLNASIGIVTGRGYDCPEDILRDADTAMYQAKALGKGRYQVFEPAMHERAQLRLCIETDLRRAIERQEFRVCYQPIVSLTTDKLIGFEALVRWHHPEKGRISPTDFIPISEENGLIIDIGQWVMQEACQQARKWQLQFPHCSDLKMSVNLSVLQFAQVDLVDQLEQMLSETGLQPQYLNLEITESAMMENTEWTTNILQELRSRQIQLSIDDFGTGYSSLSYLHRFPVDCLKIDRSFVSCLTKQSEHISIVRSILTIAHTLGMKVTAEGVEDLDQVHELKRLECDFAQGYWFAKPLGVTDAERLIQEKSDFVRVA